MTEQLTCGVCKQPIVGQVHTIGPRHYCADHYDKAKQGYRAPVKPVLTIVAALAAFVVAVAAIGSVAHAPSAGGGLVLLGIVLAIVPAALWLAAFYYQDRLEPEPVPLILEIFVLGALLAEAIGQPVIRDLFHAPDWLGSGGLMALVGSILVIGFTQEFLKYAAVRYTIFLSAHFDEEVDGVIYAAAAGLGYATVLNIQYVVSNGGVDLAAGVARVTVTALAQASFSGLVGYFLGRAKFEPMGPLWLPLGVALAATFNGLVTYGINELAVVGGLSPNGWYGLALSVVVAGATFAALFRLTGRMEQAELAASV